MSAIIFLGSLFAASIGCLLMRFVVRQNLPVPKGRFLGLRFLLWWELSVAVGAVLFLFPLLVGFTAYVEPYFGPIVRDDELIELSAYVLSLPIWFGIGYDLKLQFFSRGQARNG